MSKIFKNCSWCVPHIILLLALFVSVGFMLGSSLRESAVMDELAHIPAGYGYVKYLDFRLNPEHPPLIKALSALPLSFMHLQFPTTLAPWASDLNGQWDGGRQFLYEVNDGRADEIVFMSRLFPIVLAVLLVVLVYAWSKKLFGPWWGLFPAFLTMFSPHVLAHGHYVTTDIGASLGFFLGLFGFFLFVKKFSWRYAVYAGFLFGVAQLLKFSLVLLVPLYVFFILALWVSRAHQESYRIFSRQSWRYAVRLVASLALIFLVGYALVWAVYVLFTWNYPIEKQVSDTTILLTDLRSRDSIMSTVANTVVWMAHVPVVRGIGHYALGVLMVGQRSSGGNTAYFLGQDGNGGWWNYFPMVFVLKESIPALILLVFGFFAWGVRFFRLGVIRGFWRRMTSFVWNDFALFGMFVFVVFYWVYSIRSPLNIGFRHILPTVPFLYILIASSLKKWIHNEQGDVEKSFWVRLKEVGRKGMRYGLLSFLLLWVFVETAVAYPYFISYFNEAGGGVWRGYQHVVDSNYDWGQDLKRLQEFVQTPYATSADGEKLYIKKIAVDYFGGGHVPYYIPNAILWDESKGNPLSENVEWLAVSINELIYDIHAVDPSGPEFGYRRYRWLPHSLEPYARVGTSMFVFRLR